MKNINLGILIVEVICGLVCAGLGIYYCTADKTLQGVVFIIVGAVCIVTGIRTFLLMRKDRKNKDDEDKKV